MTSIKFSPLAALDAVSETAPWTIAGFPEFYNGMEMEIVSGQTEPVITSDLPLEPGLSWWGVTSSTGQRCSLRARSYADALSLCSMWMNATPDAAIPLLDTTECAAFMRGEL